MGRAGEHYRARQFIEAIPGTGGIISAIAQRVGCNWHTARRYIEKYATVKQAYEDECGRYGDEVETTLLVNLRLVRKKQKDTNEPQDMGDVKWYLSRKCKDRGYSERIEAQVSGPGGGPIQHEDVRLTDEERIRAIVSLAEALRAEAGAEDAAGADEVDPAK